MAINRAEQNWPDGEAIDLTDNHEQLSCVTVPDALQCAETEDEYLRRTR